MDTTNTIRMLSADVRATPEEQAACNNDADYRRLLNNRVAIVRSVVLERLSRLGCFEKAGMMTLPLSTEEAFLNAVYHGNLGRDSSARRQQRETEDLEENYNPDFYNRAVQIELDLHLDAAADQPDLDTFTESLLEENETTGTSEVIAQCRMQIADALPDSETILGLTLIVTDEGDGFNPDEVPDPTEDETIEEASGRGLLLIRAFMDEVEFNEKGNQIRMRTYADGKKPEEESE